MSDEKIGYLLAYVILAAICCVLGAALFGPAEGIYLGVLSTLAGRGARAHIDWWKEHE